MTNEEAYNQVRPCWKQVIDRCLEIIKQAGFENRIEIARIALYKGQELSIWFKQKDDNDLVVKDFCRALWWMSRMIAREYCFICGKTGKWRKRTLPKKYRASLCREHFIEWVNTHEKSIRLLFDIKNNKEESYQEWLTEFRKNKEITEEIPEITPKKE